VESKELLRVTAGRILYCAYTAKSGIL